MSNLINKFKHDHLSSEELEELRRTTDDMSRRELEQYLEHDWLNEPIPECKPTPELNRIKAIILDNIHMGIFLKRKFKIKVISFCAAVSLCIVATVGFLYLNFAHNVIDNSINFTTADNENATVLLPDSSEVKLNQNSDLAYSPSVFKKSNRQIEFLGEGYFKIAHDERNPFTIKSGDLTITVKGTEFNLINTPSENSTILYLVNGRVDMYSSLTHQNIKVRPGQLIEYSSDTGRFQISKPKSGDNIISWYTGDIKFNNESLPDVISFLERHYNVKLSITHYPANLNQASLSRLYFNGTLPTKNLPLALSALEKVYHLKITPTPKDKSRATTNHVPYVMLDLPPY